MLLILAATPLETNLLRQTMTNTEHLSCGSIKIIAGELEGQQVLLCHGGIGQVNMALQLTRILSVHTPLAVFLCGCGGSYPDSGLRVGDLALADVEIFGDLGVVTTDTFIPLSHLNIPQDKQLAPAIKQSIPLDPELCRWAQLSLEEVACGPFVSVNCCSGTPAASLDLQLRTKGICENMEGAAAAQVCSEFNIPLLELRGISNPTGTRDPEQWDVVRGSAAAQSAILKLLQRWPDR
ncbi:futalosine hydrolase [Desulfuromusa kysingii]|uniref:Futalosine hydrolase n=1 Tax=Desulfuromusa kysingii TaxID=37625 RepID=A0A1H4ECP8_9BACT|nr:futalosine hydrolase [Desulfuromusa kysingii]SEA82607.1 futalosine hydrolase [Desulfuromusa kysingii]